MSCVEYRLDRGRRRARAKLTEEMAQGEMRIVPTQTNQHPHSFVDGLYLQHIRSSLVISFHLILLPLTSRFYLLWNSTNSVKCVFVRRRCNRTLLFWQRTVYSHYFLNSWRVTQHNRGRWLLQYTCYSTSTSCVYYRRVCINNNSNSSGFISTVIYYRILNSMSRQYH